MKQQIFNVFRKNRKVVIVMSLLTLIDAMLSFFIPVSITYLLTSVNQENLFYLAAIFVLLSIIILDIKILLNYVKKHYGIGYRTKLNLELYSKLFRVKYDKINEKGLMYF